MKTIATLISLLLISHSASAFSLVRLGMAAQMIQTETKEEACLEKALTQYEMGMCVSESNAAYKNSLADVSTEIISAYPETVLEVADSERAWAAIVKLTCKLEASSQKGGSNEALIYTSCENNQIAARIEQLVDYYEGLE